MATFDKVTPDDRLKRSQFDEVHFEFLITGAKTAAQMTLQGAPVIFGFDATSFVQADVDSLLGVVNDVAVATSFGSTAMGTDAFGFVVAHGSAKKLISVTATTYQAAGGTPVNTAVLYAGNGANQTATPNTLVNSCAVTPAGNIYGKFVALNADSVTTGAIKIVVRFEAA